MNVKGPGSLSLLNKTLSSQLHVTYVRSLSTTFRALEAQDSQGHRNTESKQEESNQASNNSSNHDNKRHSLHPRPKPYPKPTPSFASDSNKCLEQEEPLELNTKTANRMQ
ncbi:hypothetical protein ACN38_g2876 [Penicillium nordicum]|uniref:Uncharacterized protein n=1 Tax=Penicillium nordicum TaxID=229535 RepID=A0A0N0RZK6_9EURO|nr:hypothetical protein ACN38_g2876 [Penicillium nordicum]